MLLRALLVVALWLPAAQAYYMYAEEIPNGDHVPHPCKPNFLWHGVGHQIAQGGGARNPFGEDFAANGHKWTEALCRKDSDGDGRTNGQELGDPQCVWKKGQTPTLTSDISHPGVCDPWNEGDCVSKNSWLDCSRDETFDCPFIDEPEVMNITLRFPRTLVPAKETTYICFNFELPDDREYHLIATEPYIDNHNVMHHITMSTCSDSVKLIQKPEDCLMGTEGCSEGIGGWTLGMTGQCFTPKAGFLFGKGHTSMISMQFHWTNPGLVDNWYDSSGMVLYFTPKLRPYNAAILGLGQMYLSIPPGQSSWVHKGTCTHHCSQQLLLGDIQVFSGLNHMHYLGIRQNVTMKSSGKAMKVLTDDNPFSYDSPKTYVYEPPITVHPGDELTTYCTYQSRSRPKTTVYGEGSFDEMCFAFLSFYPKENVQQTSCMQWKEMDTCDLGQKCDFRIFNSSDPATAPLIKKVLESCDVAGSCRLECRAAVEEARAENSCVRNVWDYVSEIILREMSDPVLLKFLAAMNSCPQQSGGQGQTSRPPAVVTPRPGHPGGAETPSDGAGGMLLNLVKSLGSRPLLQNIIMNVNYNNNYVAGRDKGEHDDSWH